MCPNFLFVQDVLGFVGVLEESDCPSVFRVDQHAVPANSHTLGL